MKLAEKYLKMNEETIGPLQSPSDLELKKAFNKAKLTPDQQRIAISVLFMNNVAGFIIDNKQIIADVPDKKAIAAIAKKNKVDWGVFNGNKLPDGSKPNGTIVWINLK